MVDVVKISDPQFTVYVENSLKKANLPHKASQAILKCFSPPLRQPKSIGDRLVKILDKIGSSLTMAEIKIITNIVKKAKLLDKQDLANYHKELGDKLVALISNLRVANQPKERIAQDEKRKVHYAKLPSTVHEQQAYQANTVSYRNLLGALTIITALGAFALSRYNEHGAMVENANQVQKYITKTVREMQEGSSFSQANAQGPECAHEAFSIDLHHFSNLDRESLEKESAVFGEDLLKKLYEHGCRGDSRSYVFSKQTKKAHLDPQVKDEIKVTFYKC